MLLALTAPNSTVYLTKRVDDAIARFGNRDAFSIVLMQKYEDYYYGFIDDHGVDYPSCHLEGRRCQSGAA